MSAPSPASYHLGLVGYPLDHSLSPAIHAAALQALGLRGSYHLFPVAPTPAGQIHLRQLLDRLRRGELHGLNVTIPHKQIALTLVDELTPAAGTIGAVNTICRRAGRLVGDNTDAAGFYRHLLAWWPAAHHPGRAWILGAGGAARAVVYALLEAGWEVVVAARRLDQAQELLASLTHRMKNPATHALPLAHAPMAAALTSLSPDLVVHCTPVGMHPNPGACPWPAALPWPAHARVYDLVYNPRPTALLRAAQAAGLPATDGLGMLVEQAALALERWTGLSIPRAPMHAAAQHATAQGGRQATAPSDPANGIRNKEPVTR